LISQIEEKDLLKGTVQGTFQGQYAGFQMETQVIPSDEKTLDILTVKVTNSENNSSKAVTLVNYVQNSK